MVLASFPYSGTSNYGSNGAVYDPVSNQVHVFGAFVSDSPGTAGGHSVYSGDSAFDQDDRLPPHAYHDSRAYSGIEHADPPYVAPHNPGAPVPTTSIQAIRSNPGHETRLYAMPTRSGGHSNGAVASSATCNPGPVTGPAEPGAASAPEAYTTAAAAAAVAQGHNLDESACISAQEMEEVMAPGVSPGDDRQRHLRNCLRNAPTARPCPYVDFASWMQTFIAGITASLLNALGTPLLRAVQLGGAGQAFFFVRNCEGTAKELRTPCPVPPCLPRAGRNRT